MTRANKGLPAEQILSKEKLPRKSKKPTECSTCFGQKIVWNDNYNHSLPCPDCQPLDTELGKAVNKELTKTYRSTSR